MEIPPEKDMITRSAVSGQYRYVNRAGRRGERLSMLNFRLLVQFQNALGE
jgi:hypothetical protein